MPRPAGSSDALREEVIRSAWYEAFRADMRSSAVVRSVENSLQRVTAATSAASAWTSSRLALSFRCWPDPASVQGQIPPTHALAARPGHRCAMERRHRHHVHIIWGCQGTQIHR